MAAPMSGVKLSKSERKIYKKLLRSRQTLYQHDGIESTDDVTKILCVNNAGLDNGASQDEVHQLFSKYGSVSDIIMLPKKPYAFVCFGTEEEAHAAYTSLNGQTVDLSAVKKNRVTLYISYVCKVPESLSPCNQLPPGLILLEDFVDEEYAQELLAAIDWESSCDQAQLKELKHRRVKHYGYEFKYSINNVDPDDPLLEGIPKSCEKLLDKALKTANVLNCPDQLTINQYQPGQGIPPHVDTPSAFEDGLMSLSLGSQVVMDFRHPDGRHLTVLLPPNSLMIMTGESRYTWSHGITPRKSDIVPAPSGGLTLVQRGVRTSFTFRKLTGQKPGNEVNPSVPKTEQDAEKLERLHVHKVYEEIAGHFSGTRHTPWPRIVEFLDRQPTGSLMTDIGCGNGKYLGINKGLFEIGSDMSRNLLEICNQRNFQVFVGDVLTIPLRENMFDVCICIAVIHHLSTHERRRKGVSELLKILRPGGQLLIYVWAMEQKVNQVKSKYLKKGNKQGQGQNINTSKGEGQNNSSHGNDAVQQSEGVVTETKSCSDNVESDCSSNAVIQGESENLEGAAASRTVQSSHQTVWESVPCLNPDNQTCSSSEQDTDNSVSTCSSSVQENTSQKLQVHVNRTEFKQQDLLVPWQLKGKHEKGKTAADNTSTKTESKTNPDPNTFHRFYHVFKKGEIEALCSELSNCRILESYYDQGNWAVILEKI